MTERKQAIVIGAGHNGLVAASYLAKAGLRVVCLEANDSVGGMAATRSIAGEYHFPGLAHAVYPLSKAIRNDLKLDRFGYKPGQEVATIALQHDANHLTLTQSSVSGVNVSSKDAAAYATLRKQYAEFAQALRSLFENKAPRLKDMDRRDKLTLAKLGWNVRVGLGRDAMYELLRVAAINIYDVLDETFDDNRIMGAVALDAVMGHAMGPRSPGTVLTWLQRLYTEANGALCIPAGAHSQPGQVLRMAADDAGVEIRLNARVEEILIENDKVTGVRLDSGVVQTADIVVSNVDPRATFLKLVGAPRLDAMFANRAAQIRGSGVVAKLHLALDGLPTFTGLDSADLVNRLVIAPSAQFIERAFNASKYKETSEEAIFEVTIPSLHNAGLAPDGHHIMSVNVAYVPYEIVGGWHERKAHLENALVEQLTQYAPNLSKMIVARELLTPEDIERDYGAVNGHWHHGELTIHQSFMMRPIYGAAQSDTPLAGLYLCGAGCHPGGGLTGLPGRNAAHRILQSGVVTP